MTVSGAFGSYYFFPNGGKFTTLASAGRALTTSFGSGCFGSLIVAVIRTLRFLANQLRQSDNGWLAILGCCLECCIGMIEGLVDYFNTYAYTYCAMYGKAYLDAGKATWNLIKDRGVEAIINDNLVGNVLGMGGFLIAGIGALVGFLFILIKGTTGSAQQPQVVITVVLINFLIGNVLFGIISSIVDSANVSFFVCLAEDPQALAATNPELFEKVILKNYILIHVLTIIF
jgi:xanthosine utilization system XapX-like protein